MTDWTYNVKVSAETETSSFNDALLDLEEAQEESSRQFEAITQFFESEDFNRNILGALEDRLKELGDDETKEAIVPILTALMELKAGVLMLMEVKEGNIDNLMQSFKRMGEHIGEGGIQTGLDNLLNLDKERADAKEERDNQIKRLVAAFNTLVPQINKKAENILSVDETGQVEYQNRLPNVRNIGDEEEVMKQNIRKLAEIGAADFFQSLTKTSTTSGVDIFRELLKDREKNPAYKQLTDLLSNLAAVSTQIRGKKSDMESGGMDTVAEIKEGNNALFKLETERGAIIAEITDPKYWNNLKEQFLEGFKRTLDTGSIFNDSENDNLLKIIVDEMFNNLHDASIAAANNEDRKNSAGIGNPLIPFLEGKEDFIPIDVITAKINKLIDTDNFSNLKTLKGKLQDFLKEAHELGFKENSDDPTADITDKLKELVSGTGAYSKVVVEALGETINEILTKINEAIKAELYTAVTGDAPPSDIIKSNTGTPTERESQTKESLDKLMEIMEKFPLAAMTEVLAIIPSKPDFDEYFEKAQIDREDRIFQVITSVGVAADYIVSELFNVEQNIATRTKQMQDTLNTIANAPTEKKVPGTASHFDGS